MGDDVFEHPVVLIFMLMRAHNPGNLPVRAFPSPQDLPTEFFAPAPGRASSLLVLKHPVVCIYEHIPIQKTQGYWSSRADLAAAILFPLGGKNRALAPPLCDDRLRVRR